METIRDDNVNADNFRNGLLTLLDNFAKINELEEHQRAEKFMKGFLRLISTVKQAQEKGLWQKTYFNLFNTFGYLRLEAVHSNVLAYLLNPEETHGLGDNFLRSFVYRVFNIKNLPINSSAKVFREKYEGGYPMDIVVKGNNWWLVIENKIDSDEQEDQTKRYSEIWKRRVKRGENVLLAFLSPPGWQPESSDFIPVSYKTIRELLECLQFQGDSEVLVRHFTDHIFLDFNG
ncbi:MAG: PD-(D/E)XK nuclease family protein [Candidatus Methanoperedens sp.]|nr:PD-(D/E)XK nuclease family protein [Candidatus Methanoperedens sp.]